MTSRAQPLVLLGLAFTFLALPNVAAGQGPEPDVSRIKAELLARYRSFEGPAEEQTWEMWEDYFLRSPEIGNLHNTRLELGWEEYRDGSLGYLLRTPDQRAAVRFDELEVHVIDSRTAWVRGVFVNVIGEREMRPMFYDMLTRTEDGWRVFFSYVAPYR